MYTNNQNPNGKISLLGYYWCCLDYVFIACTAFNEGYGELSMRANHNEWHMSDFCLLSSLILYFSRMHTRFETGACRWRDTPATCLKLQYICIHIAILNALKMFLLHQGYAQPWWENLKINTLFRFTRKLHRVHFIINLPKGPIFLWSSRHHCW